LNLYNATLSSTIRLSICSAVRGITTECADQIGRIHPAMMLTVKLKTCL